MFPEFLLVFCQCLFFLEGTLSNKGNGKLVIINDRGEENPESIIYLVGETLELTCDFKNEEEEESKYELKWLLPLKPQNSQMRHQTQSDHMSANLTLEHLQESDSGNYVCEAFRNDPKHHISQTVQLTVKTKRDSCEKMFLCEPKVCILPRFKCDGYPDCRNSEDESKSLCGDACEGKIRCGDRCIPVSSCCYPHGPNCTTKIRPTCCPNLKKVVDYGNHNPVYLSNPEHYSDMTFLQTTIITVIGCATVFMLIITILVIVICRIHIRRSLLSTFPPRQHSLNSTAYHRTLTQEMGVCDVDVYLNRGEVPGGVLVTYNINNGVQILSEAMEPPPYSEVVSTPPREGPPPPYSPKEESDESLVPLNSTQGASPKPEVRSIRRGLSVVQVSSEPALSTLH